MWKLVFAVLISATQLAAQAESKASTDQSRILLLENAWNQAVQAKDARALDTLLAADMVYVEYDGTLMNKAEYLASVRSPPLDPLRIVNESMTVRLYDQVAVVNAVCRENGLKNGKAYSFRERFTDTWIRRGNTWECIASQSTLISPMTLTK
jgi:ketosteroid isomerase-like protein